MKRTQKSQMFIGHGPTKIIFSLHQSVEENSVLQGMCKKAFAAALALAAMEQKTGKKSNEANLDLSEYFHEKIKEELPDGTKYRTYSFPRSEIPGKTNHSDFAEKASEALVRLLPHARVYFERRLQDGY